MTTKPDTITQIIAAAQLMHDAADKLQALLPHTGAVTGRALRGASKESRAMGVDLSNFAACLAADEADAKALRHAAR